VLFRSLRMYSARQVSPASEPPFKAILTLPAYIAGEFSEFEPFKAQQAGDVDLCITLGGASWLSRLLLELPAVALRGNSGQSSRSSCGPLPSCSQCCCQHCYATNSRPPVHVFASSPSRKRSYINPTAGDGTVLHLASLFGSDDAPLPPVISFAMGTLGFLTPFNASMVGGGWGVPELKWFVDWKQ